VDSERSGEGGKVGRASPPAEGYFAANFRPAPAGLSIVET